MMNLDEIPTRSRLDAALSGIADTFRGMTAHPDESNCECHWGSAEELAQLKTPDVELDPDLLRRTWAACDWQYQDAVVRRILPQFAAALVRGDIEPLFGMEEVGRAFAKGHWQQWPAQQAAAVQEFLDAWWAHTLTESHPTVPAYEVLALCAEASETLGPWLATWGAMPHPAADQHLLEAMDHWHYDLLGDEVPWDTWGDKEETYSELTAWLVRQAPARLRAQGAPEQLLQQVRLLGLTGPARWTDPHWPNYKY